MGTAELPLFGEDPRQKFRHMGWEELGKTASVCRLCRLCESRTQVVFGEGSHQAKAIFIGEGPGENEDLQGRPFVGRAGQLLDQILAAAGIPRESVYITNMVMCRPPGNRTPQSDEIETCWPYLSRKLQLLCPQIIVALGNVPAQFFLKTTEGITKLRGQFVSWKDNMEIFPMFHPSFLLRNPSREVGSPKYLTWQDIKKLKARLHELSGGANSTQSG
jgi:DNA polymerase